MNNKMIEEFKKLGRVEGIIAYAKETIKLWRQGQLSVLELNLRITVMEEMETLWKKQDEDAEREEIEDRGSYADQMEGGVEA